MKYFLLFLLTATAVFAAPTSPLNSLDGPDFIMIATSCLALLLGCISAIAYRRDGRPKILLVTSAFFLFFLKGALIIGGDMIPFEETALDMIANLLDFAVLACFFAAMVKK